MRLAARQIGWIATACVVLASCSALAADADLRVLLREHLRNPEYSLDRKPEYVVTDPAFIEPVLDQALKYLRIDYSRPLSPADLTRAKQNAVTYYKLGLAKPEGLKALEARIAARFAKPVATSRISPGNPPREAVELDYGWMIGPLTKNTRYGIEHDRNGEHVEGWGPSTRVLAGLLADAARVYPKAERIVLTIVFPRSRLGREIRITYVRSGFPQTRNGWVILDSKTAPTTRPLYQVRVNGEDFSPYRDGRHTFYADCAPSTGAARTPQTAAPTAVQRQQCLNYMEQQ